MITDLGKMVDVSHNARCMCECARHRYARLLGESP